MSSVSIRHISPELRVYAGPKSLDGLGSEVSRAGATRLMLISGHSMTRYASAMEHIDHALGERLVVRFHEVREHSPLPKVDHVAQLMVEEGIDGVVAVGGGSAIVTARAAVIIAAEQKSVRDLCTYHDGQKLVSPRLTEPKIPQWIVPSTPTTAYAKAGAAVRDPEAGDRLALFDPKARAAGLFFHPDMAATAPVSIVRGAALNAASMAVEGLQSGVHDPLAIADLRYGLLQLRQGLQRIDEGADGDVGVQLMLASLLVGRGSDHVGTGLSQPIAHALGPRSNVSNGILEAMMLPHVMTFNAESVDAGILDVAEALAPAREPSVEVALDAVRDLLAIGNVPLRLREVGIDEGDLESAVDHILGDWSATRVPRPANADQLRELLREAW